ncbi:major capsid protein [Capybara microvirus Cap1_SP_55]|nr:major capsid protein [Capybara microvirus Cap1_SP_55]
MKNNNLDKIKVSSSGHPKARFNLSHDVNTTSNWGHCQPLVCRQLRPKSKVSLSVESLVRLAPMVAPTFGRVHYKTWSGFVPISDLISTYGDMMAETPVTRGGNTYVPHSLPMIGLDVLSSFVLVGSRCTAYELVEGDEYGTQAKWRSYKYNPYAQGLPSDLQNLVDNYFKQFWQPSNLTDWPSSKVQASFNYLSLFPHRPTSASMWLPSLNTVGDGRTFFIPSDPSTTLELSPNYEPVHLDSADYVLVSKISPSDPSKPDKTFAFAFRLSNLGQRIRKALIGCGYQINFDVTTPVSLIPLMSYFKFWFDTFAPQTFSNYQTTAQFKLIQKIENENQFDLTLVYDNLPWRSLLVDFIAEIGECWYTDGMDYVSSHLPGVSLPMSDGYIDVSDSLLDTDVDNAEVVPMSHNVIMPGDTAGGDLGHSDHSAYSRIKHTALSDKFLMKLYKRVNNNSIAGKVVAKILRLQGLGDYVDGYNSNFIGYDDTIVTISDVTSVADTFKDGSGSLLGEYSGKGVQYNNSKIHKYENKEFGYLITLCSVVPDSGYCQGLDPSVLASNKWDLYNPEFDGLGFEATRKALICGTGDWFSPSDGFGQEGTFGYIPRYSSLKVANNKLNGDFSRKSTRNTYLPFTLDRYMPLLDRSSYVVDDVEQVDVTTRKLFTNNEFPIAGNVWRFPTRWDFLGNFNRPFANVGSEGNSAQIIGDEFVIFHSDNDNFLVHNIVKLIVWEHAKPIESSFGTDDDGQFNGETEKE